MLLECTKCEEEFEDEDTAKTHVREAHSDVCDECLQEYIEDSINDAYEELIVISRFG